MKEDYPYQTTWNEIFIIFAIFIAAMLLLSCNTEKKLTAKAETFVTKFPVPAHEYFRGKYPCVETKSDTTFFVNDTTIYVDCPDTISASQYFTLHDTVILAGKTIVRDGKAIKVPVTLPQKTITVVKTIEDLSRIAEMDIKLVAKKKESDKFHEGRDDWRKWFFILLGITLVSWIPYGIKLSKSLSVKRFIP